jgi:hypothetical protein
VTISTYSKFELLRTFRAGTIACTVSLSKSCERRFVNVCNLGWKYWFKLRKYVVTLLGALKWRNVRSRGTLALLVLNFLHEIPYNFLVTPLMDILSWRFTFWCCNWDLQPFMDSPSFYGLFVPNRLAITVVLETKMNCLALIPNLEDQVFALNTYNPQLQCGPVIATGSGLPFHRPLRLAYSTSQLQCGPVIATGSGLPFHRPLRLAYST